MAGYSLINGVLYANISGTVFGPSGALNGALIDAFDESLFDEAPVAGQAPPANAVLGTTWFNQDASGNVVFTGGTYGGNGQWQIYVPDNHAYYVRVQYPGQNSQQES